MHGWRMVLLCGLAFCGAPAVSVDCAALAENPQVPSAETNASSAAPGWVSELVEIRRQFGAGPLAGSLLEPAPGESERETSEAFIEALQRVADEAPPAPVVPAQEQRESSDAGRISPDEDELRAALTRAATLLYEKADRREADQQYRQADRCRRLARRLRREAGW